MVLVIRGDVVLVANLDFGRVTSFDCRRTARRVFWYVLSCAIVLWVVKWLQELEGVGMAWIIVTAVGLSWFSLPVLLFLFCS